MEPISLAVTLLIGLIVGALVSWLIHQARGGSELADQRAEIARLNGQLEQVDTAQQMLEAAKVQFSETAKLTAAEALQSNSKQFMELSEQNLGKTMEQAKSELEQRHRQFQELVKPLSENYSKETSE